MKGPLKCSEIKVSLTHLLDPESAAVKLSPQNQVRAMLLPATSTSLPTPLEQKKSKRKLARQLKGSRSIKGRKGKADWLPTSVARRRGHGRKLKLKEIEHENGHVALRMK
jgi:hypothetical protein